VAGSNRTEAAQAGSEPNLLNLLRKGKMSASDARELLDSCVELLQRMHFCLDARPTRRQQALCARRQQAAGLRVTNSERAKRLHRVADAAHSLKRALAALDDSTLVLLNAWRKSEREDGDGTAAPVNNIVPMQDAVTMADTLDGLDTLALAAECAADTERFSVSKGNKPEHALAREMVLKVASEYRRITGKLPPAGEGGWFSPFMTALGERVRLKIGARITSGVVRHMRHHLTRAAKRPRR